MSLDITFPAYRPVGCGSIIFIPKPSRPTPLCARRYLLRCQLLWGPFIKSKQQPASSFFSIVSVDVGILVKKYDYVFAGHHMDGLENHLGDRIRRMSSRQCYEMSLLQSAF